jgi:hypothetical protein
LQRSGGGFDVLLVRWAPADGASVNAVTATNAAPLMILQKPYICTLVRA